MKVTTTEDKYVLLISSSEEERKHKFYSLFSKNVYKSPTGHFYGYDIYDFVPKQIKDELKDKFFIIIEQEDELLLKKIELAFKNKVEVEIKYFSTYEHEYESEEVYYY